VILAGLDHSDFCPGFQVPGDIYPSDVSKDQAMIAIGEAVGAFLNVQAGVSVNKSIETLQIGQSFTRDDLLKPLLSAYTQTKEKETDATNAPWCELAQKKIAGIKTSDVDRLEVISVYLTEAKDFKDTHVGYTPVENNHVQFNVVGHDDYYSDSALHMSTMCISPAEDIGCKLASADRVAEQLGLTADQYDGSLTCADMNQYAIDLAEQIMQSTENGRKALDRFKSRGRPICLGDDFAPPGNIGPLFVKERISIKDDFKDNCLKVKSLKDETDLKSRIFPGIHYCKFLSPARVIEYYMTDSLKSKSTCMNTNSVEELL